MIATWSPCLLSPASPAAVFEVVSFKLFGLFVASILKPLACFTKNKDSPRRSGQITSANVRSVLRKYQMPEMMSPMTMTTEI